MGTASITHAQKKESLGEAADARLFLANRERQWRKNLKKYKKSRAFIKYNFANRNRRISFLFITVIWIPTILPVQLVMDWHQ